MEWTKITDNPPIERDDKFGNPKEFLIGRQNEGRRILEYRIAFVKNGKIYIPDCRQYASLPHWTHWLDIDEVPGE